MQLLTSQDSWYAAGYYKSLAYLIRAHVLREKKKMHRIFKLLKSF